VSGRERTEERLEAAGWERWRPQDLRVVFWRNPKDGLWHAQGEAIALLEGRPVGHGDAVTSQEEARALEEAGWEPRGGPRRCGATPRVGSGTRTARP
jgi:hypothetical protein